MLQLTKEEWLKIWEKPCKEQLNPDCEGTLKWDEKTEQFICDTCKRSIYGYSFVIDGAEFQQKMEGDNGLITVDEHNAMIANKGDELRNTGVLCPQCEKSELLWDLDINPRLTDPPQKKVVCSSEKCIYQGYLRI